MPEIKFFDTETKRKKFMKWKKFQWFVTFEYVNRHWNIDYVINFIY